MPGVDGGPHGRVLVEEAHDVAGEERSPAASKAVIMCWASAEVRPSGFSQIIGPPASNAASASSA